MVDLTDKIQVEVRTIEMLPAMVFDPNTGTMTQEVAQPGNAHVRPTDVQTGRPAADPGARKAWVDAWGFLFDHGLGILLLIFVSYFVLHMAGVIS